MKTPEEMMEYFRSMPAKKKENPYWQFEDNPPAVCSKVSANMKRLDLKGSKALLMKVREFFRRYYESFHTEAQVLCVTNDDAEKLSEIGVPVLCQGKLDIFDVTVVVLPQDNHMGTSVISESFWQNCIVNNSIVPVARIHSHHVLEPYQSATDYSTLNSGTLEMVIGKILDEPLHVCYWLDVPGTDIKAQTFVARENHNTGNFDVVPHQFNGRTKPVEGANLNTAQTKLFRTFLDEFPYSRGTGFPHKNMTTE